MKPDLKEMSLSTGERIATSIAGIFYTIFSLFFILAPIVYFLDLFQQPDPSKVSALEAAGFILLLVVATFSTFWCARYTYRGISGYKLVSDATSTESHSKTGHTILINFVELPFRIVWNLLVIIVAITLEVMWVAFIFGSVVGVILLLIFMPQGFLLPMTLLNFVVPLWSERPDTQL